MFCCLPLLSCLRSHRQVPQAGALPCRCHRGCTLCPDHSPAQHSGHSCRRFCRGKRVRSREAEGHQPQRDMSSAGCTRLLANHSSLHCYQTSATLLTSRRCRWQTSRMASLQRCWAPRLGKRTACKGSSTRGGELNRGAAGSIGWHGSLQHALRDCAPHSSDMGSHSPT